MHPVIFSKFATLVRTKHKEFAYDEDEIEYGTMFDYYYLPVFMPKPRNIRWKPSVSCKNERVLESGTYEIKAIWGELHEISE